MGPHPASRGSRLRGVRAAGPHPRVLQGPTCPFHTNRRPPVNGRAKGPVLPRPAAGDRQPATILIRSSFSTRMMALACGRRRSGAAMTAGRRSHRAERSPATPSWLSWPCRAVLRALYSGGSWRFRNRHSGPAALRKLMGPAAPAARSAAAGLWGPVSSGGRQDDARRPVAPASRQGGHQRPWPACDMPGRRLAPPMIEAGLSHLGSSGSKQPEGLPAITTVQPVTNRRCLGCQQHAAAAYSPQRRAEPRAAMPMPAGSWWLCTSDAARSCCHHAATKIKKACRPLAIRPLTCTFW